MTLTLSFDVEDDGRHIASVRELPGVHAYGATRDEAAARAQALTFEVLADEIANGERDPKTLLSLTFVPAQAA